MLAVNLSILIYPDNCDFIHPSVCSWPWPQELDLKNWKLMGERHYLWRGAMYGGVFVEGPWLGPVGPQGDERNPKRHTYFLFLLVILQDTLLKTNIAPENRPLEKEIPIGNHHF